MKALVLGASGHVGNAICRELLDRGIHVTAARRRPQAAENLAGLPIDQRVGDCEDPSQLDRWLSGHDWVFDAAAPYAFWLGEQPSPERARQLAAARMDAIIETACRHHAGLVHVGSFTALPRERRGMDAAQGAILRRLHPYFELKQIMQERVLAACQHDLRGVVVNPTLCLGPFDLKPPQFCLIPVTLKGELPAVNSHPINVIDVRDVATATVNAALGDQLGEAIALSGHNTTVDSLTSAICRIGGGEAPRLHVPPSIPAMAAYGNEFLVRARLSQVEYPSVGMLLLLEQSWMAASPICRELLPQLRPLSRSIAEAIDWYRAIGHLDRPSTATMGQRAS